MIPSGRKLSFLSNCKLLIIFVAFMLSCLVSCKKISNEPAGKNYSNELKYARQLKMWTDKEGSKFAEVYSDDNYSVPIGLYIFPNRREEAERYQEEFPNAVIINHPSKNLLVYSSVFTSAIDELGAFDTIGGVVDAQYFTDPKIKSSIASGRIKDYGTSQLPSSELLIALKPSLALVSFYNGMEVSALKSAEIPIVYMADNLETNPLGRAEWIKFLAYIAGRPEKGEEIFQKVERNYNALKAKATESSNRPTILVENMYEGIWYVPGGNSYAAHLIEDAGGKYIWSDNKDAGSLSLSFEDVLGKAKDADIWLLKLFGTDLSADKLKAMDERNMLFKPAQVGNVWYSNTETSGLFDEFPYHPDLLLNDYLLIFHPELTGESVPHYFKRMAQ